MCSVLKLFRKFNKSAEVQAASPIMKRFLCQQTSSDPGLLSVCALWVWTEGWQEGPNFYPQIIPRKDVCLILGVHANICMFIWRKTAHRLCSYSTKFSQSAQYSVQHWVVSIFIQISLLIRQPFDKSIVCNLGDVIDYDSLCILKKSATSLFKTF